MNLIPAIDLKDGRCVRLLQGEFDAVTEYDETALRLAERYADWGADWIHVVDLDGAETGGRKNAATIEALCSDSGASIQSGGGIRSPEALNALFDAGVSRAVIGSVAVDDPGMTREWLAEFGAERIVPAFDVRLDGGDPMVTTHGWKRTTDISLWEAVETLAKDGLRQVLCTDIGRDGALSGPNVELYTACARRFPDVEFQASGGVADASDLGRLAASGARAAICGKALLEGRITREEARPFLPNA